MKEEELLARLGRALADEADGVEDLVREALVGGREEVLTILRRVVVREQLDRVLSALETRQAYSDQTQGTGDGTVVHLHGVVPASGDRRPWHPTGDVRLVESGSVAGLVRPVPQRPFERLHELDPADSAWFEREVRRHEEVLEEARAHVPVVPLRFGCVLSDDDRVRALLREHAHAMLAALSRVTEHDEWRVRIRLSPETGSSRPEVRVQEMDERLAAVADERLRRPVDETDVAAELALLVPRDGEGLLQRELEVLASEHGPEGFRLEVSGPWPAYSFVADLEVGA